MSASALTAAGHQTVLETLRAELAEGEARAAEAVAAAEGRTATAAAETVAMENRTELAEARAARVNDLLKALTASEAKTQRLQQELAKKSERAEAAAMKIEHAVDEVERVVEGYGETGALEDREEVLTEKNKEAKTALATLRAAAAAVDGSSTVELCARAKDGTEVEGGEESVQNGDDGIISATAILEERLAALEEELSLSRFAAERQAQETASLEKAAEAATEAAAATVEELTKEKEIADQGISSLQEALRASRMELDRMLEKQHQERTEMSEAAGKEVDSLREAFEAAQAEVGKTREDAAKQAEELSSRLMGALEEREEGLRREASAAKEVERLKKEVAEAAAVLEVKFC